LQSAKPNPSRFSAPFHWVAASDPDLSKAAAFDRKTPSL